MEAPYLDELQLLSEYKRTGLTPEEITDMIKQYTKLNIKDRAPDKRPEMLRDILKDLEAEIKDAENYGYPNAYNGLLSGLNIAKRLVVKRIEILERGADV